jgi:asparagine synthetase B (glutamine-hydrolysing)
MCGIAGFVGTGDRAVLQRMTDAIRYRGPDAEGHWVDPSEAFIWVSATRDHRHRLRQSADVDGRLEDGSHV